MKNEKVPLFFKFNFAVKVNFYEALNVLKQKFDEVR